MNWIVVIEWLARIILFMLFVLSCLSLAVIIDRFRFFKESNRSSSDSFKNMIRTRNRIGLEQAALGENSFWGKLMRELLWPESADKIDRAFSSFVVEERVNLEKGLSILGTLGATTPFIGLLGTVLGIIVSFARLSENGASTNTVMYSLAEALILTAAGLIVAIPSVIAFNYFSRKVKIIISEGSSLKDLFIAYK